MTATALDAPWSANGVAKPATEMPPVRSDRGSETTAADGKWETGRSHFSIAKAWELASVGTI